MQDIGANAADFDDDEGGGMVSAPSFYFFKLFFGFPLFFFNVSG